MRAAVVVRSHARVYPQWVRAGKKDVPGSMSSNGNYETGQVRCRPRPVKKLCTSLGYDVIANYVA